MGESSTTHGSSREIKASVGEGRGGEGTEWVSSRPLTSAIGGKEGERRRGGKQPKLPVSRNLDLDKRPSRVKVNLRARAPAFVAMGDYRRPSL